MSDERWLVGRLWFMTAVVAGGEGRQCQRGWRADGEEKTNPKRKRRRQSDYGCSRSFHLHLLPLSARPRPVTIVTPKAWWTQMKKWNNEWTRTKRVDPEVDVQIGEQSCEWRGQLRPKLKYISQMFTSVWNKPIRSSAETPVPAEERLRCSFVNPACLRIKQLLAFSIQSCFVSSQHCLIFLGGVICLFCILRTYYMICHKCFHCRGNTLI